MLSSLEGGGLLTGSAPNSSFCEGPIRSRGLAHGSDAATPSDYPWPFPCAHCNNTRYVAMPGYRLCQLKPRIALSLQEERRFGYGGLPSREESMAPKKARTTLRTTGKYRKSAPPGPFAKFLDSAHEGRCFPRKILAGIPHLGHLPLAFLQNGFHTPR